MFDHRVKKFSNEVKNIIIFIFNTTFLIFVIFDLVLKICELFKVIMRVESPHLASYQRAM